MTPEACGEIPPAAEAPSPATAACTRLARLEPLVHVGFASNSSTLARAPRLSEFTVIAFIPAGGVELTFLLVCAGLGAAIGRTVGGIPGLLVGAIALPLLAVAANWVDAEIQVRRYARRSNGTGREDEVD